MCRSCGELHHRGQHQRQCAYAPRERLSADSSQLLSHIVSAVDTAADSPLAAHHRFARTPWGTPGVRGDARADQEHDRVSRSRPRPRPSRGAVSEHDTRSCGRGAGFLTMDQSLRVQQSLRGLRLRIVAIRTPRNTLPALAAIAPLDPATPAKMQAGALRMVGPWRSISRGWSAYARWRKLPLFGHVPITLRRSLIS
jgi:hypothetical protein